MKISTQEPYLPSSWFTDNNTAEINQLFGFSSDFLWRQDFDILKAEPHPVGRKQVVFWENFKLLEVKS